MQFDILTIFPQILDSYINESILRRAQEKGAVKINFHDIRKFTEDRHKQVDDTPYGGGPGMIFKVQPIYECLQDVLGKAVVAKRAGRHVTHNMKHKTKIIMMSPRGKQFDQKEAEELSKLDQLILITGRYEGVDARVERFVDEQLSIGPYVLSGGELPAMVVVEAVARLLPGVLGSADSLSVESFGNQKSGIIRHLVEYPQYTRPEIFKPAKGIKWRVPEVLLSGDHKRIEEWRKKQMQKKSR